MESVWNPNKRHSDKRVIHNCGRADGPDTAERMRRLARSIMRRCAPEEIILDNPAWKLQDAWPFGDIYVLEELWKQLGVPEAIAPRAKGRKLGFAVERALFAMVANRACAPASKLYCYETMVTLLASTGTKTMGCSRHRRAHA